MKAVSYRGYRFPPAIIQQAISLYLRFTLSLRDVEDLLAERGIAVSCETIRRWVGRFGPVYARRPRAMSPAPTGRWHLDVSEAECKAQIQPKGVLNDGRWEPISAVAQCLHRRTLPAVRCHDHGSSPDVTKPFGPTQCHATAVSLIEHPVRQFTAKVRPLLCVDTRQILAAPEEDTRSVRPNSGCQR